MLPKYLLVTAFLSYVLANPFNNAGNSKPNDCPAGWKSYRDSCYFFESQTMHFEKAEVKCLEKGSTMFVADSMDEWDTIVGKAAPNFYTWVGLERPEDEPRPIWKAPGGIPASKLNWLQSGQSNELNGWTPYTRCAAHFNGAATKYTYFHYCGSFFNSICERNVTLLSKIWERF